MLRKTVGMNVIEKGDVVECDSVAFQQLTIQTDRALKTANEISFTHLGDIFFPGVGFLECGRVFLLPRNAFKLGIQDGLQISRERDFVLRKVG